MREYQRPTLPVVTFSDEKGDPIEYGSRWGAHPPEESYSRVTNPERFAPIHSVADALIRWLERTFDVAAEVHEAVSGDLLRAPEDPLRAVRLTPNAGLAAPLTFVFTSFPGVELHAGALHDFRFPVCGCDGCDIDIISLTEDLEWTVHTVVSGGYSERVQSWPTRWVQYRLNEPGITTRSGRTRVQDLPKHRAKMGRRTLPRSGQWEPWPTRTSPRDP